MILNDIRELKQVINNLQMQVENFTVMGAIRYDKEPVQTSPSGDSLELAVIRKVEQEQKIQRLTDKWTALCNEVDLNQFTVRQQEFIVLYYFEALSMNRISKIMKVKYPALSKIKFRINSAKHLHGN